MRDIGQLIRQATIFRRLSAEDSQRLARLAVAKHYGKGETIFREQDDSVFLYTILQGRVKVFKTTASGQEAILEIFGPGDPLGAVAVYERRPYPASAAALQETTCIQIERSAFFSLLERYPSIVRGLLSGLTLRLVELTNRVAELSGGRVQNRLARLLVRFADEFGRPTDEGIFVPLALTRQELADMTGTTVETCIRIMSRWRKRQVVRTQADGFVIQRREVLELLVDGRS